jgi:hypothetical protein
MSEETNEVQAEEVQGTQDAQSIEDVQEVLAIDYQEILKSYAESAQNLGQIIWVDSVSEKSNKINVVRVLKDGTKQLFSLVITEEEELTMSK